MANEQRLGRKYYGEVYTMWTQWKKQAALLENIAIPQRVLCDDPVKVEFHGFCDASEAAYGPCIYLRSINARKRFIARRGKCLNLYSDNSTTFVGADNQLLELREFLAKSAVQAEVQEYLPEQFISWKFIPPYSPHIGGL